LAPSGTKRVTGAGLLLFGTDAMLRELCPQHQVQYILETSSVDVARNDFLTGSLLLDPVAASSGPIWQSES